jgi:hypothetical protein
MVEGTDKGGEPPPSFHVADGQGRYVLDYTSSEIAGHGNTRCAGFADFDPSTKKTKIFHACAGVQNRIKKNKLRVQICEEKAPPAGQGPAEQEAIRQPQHDSNWVCLQCAAEYMVLHGATPQDICKMAAARGLGDDPGTNHKAAVTSLKNAIEAAMAAARARREEGKCQYHVRDREAHEKEAHDRACDAEGKATEEIKKALVEDKNGAAQSTLKEHSKKRQKTSRTQQQEQEMHQEEDGNGTVGNGPLLDTAGTSA